MSEQSYKAQTRDELVKTAEERGLTVKHNVSKDDLVQQLVEQDTAASAGAVPPHAPEDNPPVAPEPSEPQAGEGKFEDDEYTVEQLLENAPMLLGQESYMVKVALRRYGGGGNNGFYSLKAAQDAVDELANYTPEETV